MHEQELQPPVRATSEQLVEWDVLRGRIAQLESEVTRLNVIVADLIVKFNHAVVTLSSLRTK